MTSVLPFFLDELKKGNIPITDKRMTRFLISLEESVDLIEWACNHPDSHGNIVVPKLKSLKVTELAKELGKSYNIDDIAREPIIAPYNFPILKTKEKLQEDLNLNIVFHSNQKHIFL